MSVIEKRIYVFSVAKATLETALFVRSSVRSSRYNKSIINQEFFKRYESSIFKVLKIKLFKEFFMSYE